MTNDIKSTSFWQTVPGMLTAFAGIITAIAGLILALYQIGFLGGAKSPPTNANPASLSSTTGTASVVSTPNTIPQSNESREIDAPPRTDRGRVQVDISGSWQDTDGTYYEITQEGNLFKGRAKLDNIESAGSGTLNGREYTSTFSTNRPSRGSCKGIVSADGKTITSNCWDSAIGYFSTRMYR